MASQELVITPNGVFVQKTERRGVSAEVAEAIFAAVSRDFYVCSPNLGTGGHPVFSEAYHFGMTQGHWFIFRMKKILWNGNWLVTQDGICPSADDNGAVKIQGEGLESLYSIPVPASVPLFLVVPVAGMNDKMYLLTYKVNEATKVPVWCRLPLPNVFNDGSLCTGYLGSISQSLPLFDKAMIMAERWATNTWNSDLADRRTVALLNSIGKISLPDGTNTAKYEDWEKHFIPVNPEVAIGKMLPPIYTATSGQSFPTEEKKEG